MKLVAHAGGMGWDELLVFASPVVILIALQIASRRRAREAGDPEQDDLGGDDEDEETA